MRLIMQKSGEGANDGRLTCAGLQGRAERVAEQWSESVTPKSRLRDAFAP
ncbi:MAG: hypothetical protein ACFNKL_04200 [Treponema sp.]